MQHRLKPPRTYLGKLTAAAIGVAAVAAATVGGVAAFAGTNDPTYSSLQGVHACISTDGQSRLYNGAIYRNASHPTCPNGYARLDWATNAQGAPGKDATLTVTAATNVSNWPETSGWANDSFTRTLTVTRQAAAESSKCGGTPSCYFYTASLADSGSFVTAIGHPSPNPSKNATIANAVQGNISGVARAEFYASSDTPNAALVPVSANAAPKPAGTSDWYKLAFAEGTTIAGGNLTAYSWDYTTACEKWHDSINPGDDGAGAADGDIAGSVCS